jgi:S1-C subfamily serine protease/predicted esterase
MKFAMPMILSLLILPQLAAQGVNDATEKAIKDSAAKAAPWVVQIQTSGGSGTLPAGGGRPGQPPPTVRKGVGPTTGVIVDPDGYIISSSFNFANKPTDINVLIPGHERKVATVVGQDTSRMLTLLKVDLKGLPTPKAFPKKDIKVGQWSMALGRGGFQDDIANSPTISTGIISALGRIWGKAVQTDAKISPVNYGGPLMAIDGRVFGILVPASPKGEGETAGVEWYDSGIGFAIPLEDVYAALPRLKALKQGKTLNRGLLGFTPQNANEQYNVPVIVAQIAPDSAAMKAGLKAGDKIIEIDGKPVTNISEMMHILGPKYEGDVISMKVERDGKVESFASVTLGGVAATFAQPFLGMLPMRDDPDAGVEVRFVYPKSPADSAGLKEGDRIMKVGPVAPAPGPGPRPMPPMPPGPAPAPGGMLAITGGKAQLAQVISRMPVGMEVKLEVKRKDGGKTETLSMKLAAVPEELPEKIPYPSSKERAGDKPMAPAPLPGFEPKEDPQDPPKEDPKENDDDIEKGFVERENKVLAREYWMYIPDNYKKNRSYGVIIWLHDKGKVGKDGKDMKKIWENYCDQANYILIGPKSKNLEGWNATEAESVVQTINEAIKGYTIDRNRIFAHGMGLGGFMGLYLGFNARDLVRGVAVSGAALSNNPKDNLPNQPLAFFLVAGDKDPMIKDIQETRDKLKEKKFPVIYREIKDFGKEYLDQKTMDELVVWIDTLDRI